MPQSAKKTRQPPASTPPRFVIGLRASAGEIEALVLGLLEHCGRLDRLHIEVRKHGDTARIEAWCNRILLSGTDAIFGPLSAARCARSGSAYAYLHCAVALLTLRAEQIQIVSGAGQLIEISL